MTYYRAAGTQSCGRPGADSEVDQVMLAEALAGHRVPLDRPTLAAALDRLDDGTRSAEQLARRIGCSQRTVQRHRARRRQVTG